jgi:peptidoglycan/LPS O-acetylase OafA/YrhL
MSETPRAQGTAARTDSRLSALDGLRGVAAAIVVLHHTLLLTPAISNVYMQGPFPERGSMAWWLSYTPLKIASAGSEAVLVFFVLSGLVLALPVLRRTDFDWSAYYPRRMVRLYVPVIASVLLAVVLVLAVPQVDVPSGSKWLFLHSIPELSWPKVIHAMSLFDGDFQLNNPLWSLQWEIAFSVCLPVFVLGAFALRRLWLVGVLAALVASWIGLITGTPSLTYLPVFFAGTLLAVGLPDIRRLADRLAARWTGHLVWVALLVGAGLALVAPWLIGADRRLETLPRNLAGALVPFAAVVIVVCALGWRPLAAVLSRGVLRQLGLISFSLYLVHAPVLVFTSHLMAGQSRYLINPIALTLCVLVAYGFYWLVEKRSHEWARRVGAWGSRTMRREPTPAQEPATATTVSA